ncbi:IS66 family transposase [Xylophilus sp. GW821-FHT01B05]
MPSHPSQPDLPALPDLSTLSHAQKDELIRMLWPLLGQVQSLTAQLAVMQARITELEARLALNSRNSSKPPSSDGLAKPAPKSLRPSGQRPLGGQKGHGGHTLRQSAEVDQVITHQSAPRCNACQELLAQHEVIAQRQVFELPALRAQVIEHQLIRSTCRCGAVHQGSFPEGISAPTQYGPRAKALAVHLNQHHLVPLQRTCELLRDAFGLPLSQASVLAFCHQAAQTLAPTVAAIGQAVQGAPVVHADETGIRVKGTLAWLHCAVTASLTWLGLHAKRGSAAFEALGILPGVRGTLVHDGLASYKGLDCTHSLCNAHHLRELTFVHEQMGERIWDGWAREMMELLLQAQREVAQADSPLPLERQAWFEAQWEQLLQRGERLHPEVLPSGAPRNRQGRHQQSKAFNLLKRLRVHRREVWRFMTDADVPFTNNLAEQALRMSKVRQKVSGCFRTREGADTFFTLRSYLATMRKQRACLFDCLISVFSGNTRQPVL